MVVVSGEELRWNKWAGFWNMLRRRSTVPGYVEFGIQEFFLDLDAAGEATEAGGSVEVVVEAVEMAAGSSQTLSSSGCGSCVDCVISDCALELDAMLHTTGLLVRVRWSSSTTGSCGQRCFCSFVDSSSSICGCGTCTGTLVATAIVASTRSIVGFVLSFELKFDLVFVAELVKTIVDSIVDSIVVAITLKSGSFSASSS